MSRPIISELASRPQAPRTLSHPEGRPGRLSQKRRGLSVQSHHPHSVRRWPRWGREPASPGTLPRLLNSRFTTGLQHSEGTGRRGPDSITLPVPDMSQDCRGSVPAQAQNQEPPSSSVAGPSRRTTRRQPTPTGNATVAEWSRPRARQSLSHHHRWVSLSSSAGPGSPRVASAAGPAHRTPSADFPRRCSRPGNPSVNAPRRWTGSPIERLDRLLENYQN